MQAAVFRAALGAAFLCAAVAAPAFAHDSRVGEIAIRHPFATPSVPGAPNGAAYLAAIENKGAVADRLLRASTPAAARVEIHTMTLDAQNVMRMREIDGIALAPKAKVQMKPGAGLHLMLIGLKAPLKEDASFPMTLEFERAGKVEVKVIVGPPKPGGAEAGGHTH
ncbi:MAG: copper chaperone PCu(A)C [Caldimonas sp.]